jgi:hypothetical protein
MPAGMEGAVGSITKGSKIVRYLFVLLSLLVSTTCCHPADIKDATGRIVTVPEQVSRVLAAGPTAARPDGGFATRSEPAAVLRGPAPRPAQNED